MMMLPEDFTFNIEQMTDLLGGVAHFKSLAAQDRKAIILAGDIQRFAQGTMIFDEDAPCAGMFVLLRGQVQLHKLGPQGRAQILSVIEPVIMFNEVPVLDGGPNVVTAVASRDCMTWHVAYDTFQRLLQRYPQMGLGLLRVLAQRNRFLISQYEDLSFRTVVARVAKLLLDLSAQGQRGINRREHPNHELAARVATGPEPFSRSLSLLRKNGYVHCTRNTITIVQGDALAEIAFLDN